ncbi:histidine kinase [Sinorhizobium meliloti]|nr:histidine kinase [Sinorhizobium meliloti]
MYATGKNGFSRRAMLGGAVAIGAASATTAMSAPARAQSATSTTASMPAAQVDYRASTAQNRVSIINLDIMEEEARKAIPEFAYAFVAGGAGDEVTVRANRTAFLNYPIVSHRFVGVARDSVDTRLDLPGVSLPHPILVAPMGLHGVVHRDAEVGTAAGAGLAGALYQCSGASNRTLEEIAAATTGPKWFQLYFNNDLGVTRSILQRAAAAGFTAIVLTVDAVGPGGSDRLRRLGQAMPSHLTFANHDPTRGGSGNFRNQKAAFTPEDIAFCREASGLPVVVKGILSAKDASMSVEGGAAAVQVSNHGGRQIDGLAASIDVLPAVAEAIDGRVPVIMDGGIRRGREIFQALALGADAVAVGRPVLYGLGLGGSEGVRSVIDFLAAELSATMLLAGTAKLTDIRREHVRVG